MPTYIVTTDEREYEVEAWLHGGGVAGVDLKFCGFRYAKLAGAAQEIIKSIHLKEPTE